MAETGNIQNLHNENISLFKENQKLKEDLEVAKAKADQDAKSISLLQDNFEARLDETKAVDNELLSKY